MQKEWCWVGTILNQPCLEWTLDLKVSTHIGPQARHVCASCNLQFHSHDVYVDTGHHPRQNINNGNRDNVGCFIPAIGSSWRNSFMVCRQLDFSKPHSLITPTAGSLSEHPHWQQAISCEHGPGYGSSKDIVGQRHRFTRTIPQNG